MILHATYQGSRPSGFRQEDFCRVSPIYAYVTPGRVIFYHRGIIQTNLVEIS